MPPRARQFALAFALLIAVHAVAAGVLWTNGPEPVDPKAVGTDADTATLLAAAAHNDAAFPTTTRVRMTDPATDTTLTNYRIEADPSAARIRAEVLTGTAEAPLMGDEVYLTGWRRWDRLSGGWGYTSRRGATYDHDSARPFRPAPGTASSVHETTHANGSVTVRLEDASSVGGLLAFAGENATLTYRIAFRDGYPYVAYASADPATPDDVAVTVERRIGATVPRPDSLPAMGPQESLDRIVAGARYA